MVDLFETLYAVMVNQKKLNKNLTGRGKLSELYLNTF